jgi:anti-sigma factor RsiW
MNCHDCQPLLSAYVDESVRADERVAVERHLRTCAQCRALADDFAAIRDAAGSLEPLVPPARVWHQLSAAFDSDGSTGVH